MSVPDRTPLDPDPEAGPGGVRLCGYRHCRAPLPVVAGRGNRARYCPDGTTWGAHALSRKAAEAASLAVASLHPEDPALTPAAVEELGARLDAAVEPLREVLDAVLTVRGQVDTETRAALAERDTAVAEAADARGARQAAEDRATVAEAEAGAAAATQAGDLRDQVASLTATLRARDTALDEVRARSRGLVDDHHTELAARDTAMAARRTEHQAELDRIRRDTSNAQQRAAAEHAETVRGLRADLSAAAERRATEHAHQLAELHRQLGAADHQIKLLRARLHPNPAEADNG